MGTEIKLVGIGDPDGRGPRIISEWYSMGFGGLHVALTYELNSSRIPTLEEVPTDEPGLSIYKVVNPEHYIEGVKENRETIWDSVGENFDAGIEEMAKRPDLSWWFYAEY